MNRKRVQRLMRVMGLECLFPRPRCTVTSRCHKKYPYLLKGVATHATGCSASDFKAVGMTATSDPTKSRDGSTWSFRVDADQPDVMYATWTLKNGTKRLEEIRFKKQKR